MIRRYRAVALAILAAGISVSAQGQAHINLLSPAPRASGFPDSNLLRGPCGQRSDGRVPSKASTFRPGESIDVAWDVYVQHVSYFRISFDADGDDSFSSRLSAPSGPAGDDPTRLEPGEGEVILAYVEDPTASMAHVERRITLPNEPCDNCTLQVTQFTYGLPVKDAVYYQCADLVLAGEPANVADVDPSSAAQDAGATEEDPSAGDATDTGGCSLALSSSRRSPSGSSGAGGAAGVAAIATLFAARAWRRRFYRPSWSRR